LFPSKVLKVGKQRNNVSATKILLGKRQMFLNLIGNILVSREAKFVSATIFPRVGKWENIQGNIENHKCFCNNVSQFAQGLSIHTKNRHKPVILDTSKKI
jgi:hypothetical protein